MSDRTKIGFVVQAELGGGLAWIKRQAGPYRLGPRDQATLFVNRNAARDAITQLSENIRNSAQFSIQKTGDSA